MSNPRLAVFVGLLLGTVVGAGALWSLNGVVEQVTAERDAARERWRKEHANDPPQRPAGANRDPLHNGPPVPVFGGGMGRGGGIGPGRSSPGRPRPSRPFPNPGFRRSGGFGRR